MNRIQAKVRKKENLVAGIVLALLFLFTSIYLPYRFARLMQFDIAAITLTGTTVGVILCLVWMGDIVRNFYTQRILFFMIWYCLGAFSLYLLMPFTPVHLLLFSALGGVYIGRRIHYSDMNDKEGAQYLRWSAIFSSAVILILLAISFFILLFNSSGTDKIFLNAVETLRTRDSLLWLVLAVIYALFYILNFFVVIWSGRLAQETHHI